MKQHSNYEGYFLDMMKAFEESSELSQPDKKLDEDFRRVFMDKLIRVIKQAWADHEKYYRDTYILTEEELETVFTEAKEETVSNSLLKLSELELIKTGVNSNGEIVYSLTEKGRALAESYDKYL